MSADAGLNEVQRKAFDLMSFCSMNEDGNNCTKYSSCQSCTAYYSQDESINYSLRSNNAPKATIVDNFDDNRVLSNCTTMNNTPDGEKILLSLSNSSTPSTSFNIVTLNVSGMRYQTFAETLERYPDTLLGNALKRCGHFNSNTGEYFFDRHRQSFDAILYYYQSNGRLKRPEQVPVEIFVRELKYFEMGDAVVEKFWELEGYRKPEELPLPENRVLRYIWQVMEHPDTGILARICAFISVFVIVLSTMSFCLETLPQFHEQPRPAAAMAAHNTTNVSNSLVNATMLQEMADSGSSHVDANSNPNSPFFILELICIFWFTLEFSLRFISCPSKLVFCKSFLNWVDFVAIVPFFINLAFADGSSSNTTMSFAVLRVLRLVRVFRIFKLSRHSRGLQILGMTFRASVQELCLLVFFLLIGLVLFSSAVYFAEIGVNTTPFTSIPAAFWYAIVTMTTVGYGDMVPVGPAGKLVGSMCAIVGVLVLALPVPVIVANFKHFYRQETRLAHMRALENDEDDYDDMSSAS